MITELAENTNKKRLNYYRRNIQSTSILYDAGNSLFHENPILDTGVVEYVLSPLLVKFTTWVLEQAQKDNVHLLYFIARDGLPAFRVAQRLCEEKNYKIICRYLYCSRYSLRVPMYSEKIEEALEQICRSSIEVTLNAIMLRSGFTEDQISIMKREWSDMDFNHRIAYSELPTYRDRLKSSKLYMEMLFENSKQKWPLLKTYFEQEGMLEHANIGIVDSGWTGSTQKTINDIRKRCGCSNEITGYYFGLYEIPCEIDKSKYRAYYFSPHGGFINKLFFSNCLYETLFSAEEGTTCGYYLNGNAALPLLSDIKRDVKKEKVLQALEKFTDYYIRNLKKNGRITEVADNKEDRVWKSLHRFMWNPTRTESEWFGNLMFSDDLLDQERREVAPLFPAVYLRENHVFNRVLTFTGLNKKPIHESGWYEASVVRYGKHSLYHRMSFLCYKALSFIWHRK